LRKALRNLPKTLDDTYTRILEDIEEDLQQIAFRALTWICFSKEPLTPEQVAEAAVIDPQLCPPFHPEYRLCDPETDIRDILGSLVSAPIVESEFGKVCYLRLAHFSVKEYLLSGRILCSKRVSKFSLTELIGNALILECSLLYVFNAVDIDEIVSVSLVEKFPLHGYIGAWLVDHAQELRFQFQRKLESLIKLFLDDSAFRFWSQLFCWPRIKTKIRRYIFLEPDFDHARLFLASYCGFSEVVKALVIKTTIVGARGPCSDTALRWASSSGQEVVVELLIDSGLNVNAKMDYGYSALHFAVSSGKEATVRMLLKHKANVNVK
ncbi:ankyrin, partial [Cenococcum geophilum 1.58]|uniref:ankyrin n=1 Tax=Cenococcum geophilum 1.58 TaxID=794803 RepID=UPI00358FE30D